MSGSQPAVAPLSAEELRVLACLIEKSYTTPDQYPLSSNSLATACNQKSSRDPVVDYSLQLVDQTLQLLRDAGWVRSIRGSGNRTFKHKHVVEEMIALPVAQQAVLAVLALRGPQSPGELKTRTERYHHFEDLDEVEAVLTSLSQRQQPLTRNVGRASGQSQDRWIQLLGPSEAEPASGSGQVATESPAARPPSSPPVESPPPSPVGSPPAVVAPAASAAPAPPASITVAAVGAPPEADLEEVRAPLIDCLQYSNWSEEIFGQLNVGGVHAVHVTIAYHESFREMVANIEQWNTWFQQFSHLIFHGRTGHDVRLAAAQGRTAVFFGFQNPSPIEADIGLVEICHSLGIRFMQLTYNNQSLLASGCYEEHDGGVTRFGRQVIAEMNRVGLVIDMSHSGERSTLETIELSQRPIAITHANPAWWHPARRNKSQQVLGALTDAGGMMGFSLYPHHLAGGSDCTVQSFAEMVAEAASRYGVEHLGIGSDLCQNQPDEVVAWMRNGRWSKTVDYGEGSAAAPGFPAQPHWFSDSRDLANIAAALAAVGFLDDEVGAIMGGNWLRFYDDSFGPMP